MTTNTIRIDLDAVRVYRSKNEYRTKPRARSSLGHEITGDGPIVWKLAAVLRAENPQFEGLLKVYRGDTLCFIPTPLKTAFLAAPQPKQTRRKSQ
ncbi:hypothetical protein ACEWPL_004370 [Roseovarius sp. S1116L3]|uniref:hypothetical protein n=1 Tax=Roseovarius roseus TaxID=3342636 RepID=UPI0037263A2A